MWILRILWVVTKTPWPARDGGRVVVVDTLRALAAAGHECALVAPFDPRRESRDELHAALRGVCEPQLVAAVPRPLGSAILGARGRPVSIVRHALAPLRAEVERLVTARPVDVVHAEQLQALAQCEPARRRSLPVVLRAQNVESDLWAALAASWPLLGRVLRREVARLARYEGEAVREAAATVALTRRDAERLRSLAGPHGVVHRVAAPFPRRLPPAATPLPGEPAVVMLAGGWLPNRQGAAWFVRHVWPEVRAYCPRAVLHLFGPARGLRWAPPLVTHEAPTDSRQAFAPNAILAVPLRIASGVRVKILEAWARGIPVVATPEAAAGLECGENEPLLLADDPGAFARAIGRLHADRPFAHASVEAGRAVLEAHHDPARIAAQLAEVYAVAARGAAGRRP